MSNCIIRVELFCMKSSDKLHFYRSKHPLKAPSKNSNINKISLLLCVERRYWLYSLSFALLTQLLLKCESMFVVAYRWLSSFNHIILLICFAFVQRYALNVYGISCNYCNFMNLQLGLTMCQFPFVCRSCDNYFSNCG